MFSNVLDITIDFWFILTITEISVHVRWQYFSECNEMVHCPHFWIHAWCNRKQRDFEMFCNCWLVLALRAIYPHRTGTISTHHVSNLFLPFSLSTMNLPSPRSTICSFIKVELVSRYLDFPCFKAVSRPSPISMSLLTYEALLSQMTLSISGKFWSEHLFFCQSHRYFNVVISLRCYLQLWWYFLCLSLL